MEYYGYELEKNTNGFHNYKIQCSAEKMEKIKEDIFGKNYKKNIKKEKSLKDILGVCSKDNYEDEKIKKIKKELFGDIITNNEERAFQEKYAYIFEEEKAIIIQKIKRINQIKKTVFYSSHEARIHAIFLAIKFKANYFIIYHDNTYLVKKFDTIVPNGATFWFIGENYKLHKNEKYAMQEARRLAFETLFK